MPISTSRCVHAPIIECLSYAGWLFALAACICGMIGSTLDAKLSAALRFVAAPFACASTCNACGQTIAAVKRKLGLRLAF